MGCSGGECSRERVGARAVPALASARERHQHRAGRFGVAHAVSFAASGLLAVTVPSSARIAVPAQSWTQFRDATLEGFFRIDPSQAVYQGRHDFDGGLPDWSPAGLTAEAAFWRGVVTRAQAFPAARLTAADRFERDYMVQVARGKLFWLTDADTPHANPDYYVLNGMEPNVYVARNYAPPAVRMRALTKFLQRIPLAAAQIRANLKTPMPLSFVNYGKAGFNGFADYYAGDAVRAFAGVRDPRGQAALKAAAASASAAMRSLGGWVEAQRGTATQDFALGPARFSRMLAATEGVDVPLDRLEAIGRADLARNRAALDDVCALFAPGQSVSACMAKMNAHKPAGGPVAAARLQIPMLRRFVTERDIVTIPDREQALVEESPPYNRQNSAYIDPPGPFERGVPSIYYISPPDPAWDQATRGAFVPGEKDLLFTSIHEVMPGHFLQYRHANRSPSIWGRLFVGYSFAEGWAHYAEEMMFDAGLGDGDPETHIGQLSNALLRNCRFLSAIGLHGRGMTQDQSRRLFVEQCYQDEGTARQQAARGTYDPAYLNYTLGKLMIRKLREDWTAARGGRAGWKAFHDQVLSYGGPPIPLVRQAMMREPAARAVF